MKLYIGDSVYAELADGRLILTTENGYPDDPRNRIVLEPETYEALVSFVSTIVPYQRKETNDETTNTQTNEARS